MKPAILSFFSFSNTNLHQPLDYDVTTRFTIESQENFAFQIFSAPTERLLDEKRTNFPSLALLYSLERGRTAFTHECGHLTRHLTNNAFST